MLYVLTWWLIMQVLGLIALPLAYRLFKWLPDRGYTFAKPLGLLMVSYILWLGAMLRLLQNNLGGILFAIVLATGVSGWFYLKHKHHPGSQLEPSLRIFIRERKTLVFTLEIIFSIAFFIWALLRAYATDKIMSSGGEKFMEITFLNGTLNSVYFPPLDPWLSDFAISYYYFGYVMMALLTQLSGVSPGVGFDVYNALLFALTITGAFGIVYNLVASNEEQKPISDYPHVNNRQPLYFGLVSSFLVAVMGNLEGLLEALYSKRMLPEGFWNWIDIPDLVERGSVTGAWYPGHNWWWWRASRVLHDRDLLYQPVPINSITEFPFFSFLLGDNHPHVLALPFVFLAMALALNLLRCQMAIKHDQEQENHPISWNLIMTCLHGDWSIFVFYSLILGSLGFLNTWDFPIYLSLVVLAYGIGNYAATKQASWQLLYKMVILGAGLASIAILLYLFFYITFSSQAQGILPYVLPPTRLPQYLIMFGPFIFIVTCFLLTHLLGQAKQRGWKILLQWWGWVALASFTIFAGVLISVSFSHQGRQFIQEVLLKPDVQQVLGGSEPAMVIKAILFARLRDPWLFLIISFLVACSVVNILRHIQPPIKETGAPGNNLCNSSASNLYTFLLIFMGLALTLSVEFFYLHDSFGVRMNTVFKFYYQGWVMLGCASAYSLYWMFKPGKRISGTIGRFVCFSGAIVLVAAGMVYPLMASYSRVQGFQNEPNLDGSNNIARDNPDDWAAIEWLRANVQDTPVILEAPGKSYNYEGRISAFTGLPTVLGWSLHEGQWRGDYTEQSKREPDIEMIYSTHQGQQALQLLRKWKVKYVIVGEAERRYVEQLCSDPNRHCHPVRALEKFNGALTPVFQQNQVTIYQVP
ncbi:MAG: hypothetical protein HS114_01415 [Anaerolineales bacterium]|nr:hypothetical protein [Anaerolineales bacterium]